MTDTELSALEAAAKAATPGPWDCGGVEVFLGEWNPLIAMCNSEDNAAFITAANPAAILSLIAELRQARKERDWLVQTIKEYPICPPLQYRNEDECKNIERTMTCEDCWLQAAKEAVSCQAKM